MSKSEQVNKITTEMAEHFCDNLCKYPYICDQDNLDVICSNCMMGKFICDILNAVSKQEEPYGEN